MNTAIKKYTSDPIAFIEKVSDDQLSKIILYASKKYEKYPQHLCFPDSFKRHYRK